MIFASSINKISKTIHLHNWDFIKIPFHLVKLPLSKIIMMKKKQPFAKKYMKKKNKKK